MNQPMTLSVLPARTELYASDEPQLVYLLLKATTAAPARGVMPLNLCLVIDRSSSMRGERLFQVKEAARHLVDKLDGTSAFGLVAFNDRAEVIVPSQAVSDPGPILAAISDLEARGGTEMAQGLSMGLQEIERPKLNAVSRLILLTDGRTYGDEQACVELARRAQRRGIGLTTFGIGTEWNEDLLEMMTAGPSSRTQYIASTGEIVSVFDGELSRLQHTIARNVEFRCITHPDAQLRSFYRVQPFLTPLHTQAAGGGAWQVPVGEWPAGEDQSFLIELVLPRVGSGTQPVAKIDLSYEPVGQSTGASTVSTIVKLPAVPQPSMDVAQEPRRALERVVAYQLQQRAWQSMAEGRIDDATQRLQMAGTHLFNAGELALAETVHVEATRLLQGGTTSADGRKRIKYGTRGLVVGS